MVSKNFIKASSRSGCKNIIPQDTIGLSPWKGPTGPQNILKCRQFIQSNVSRTRVQPNHSKLIIGFIIYLFWYATSRSTPRHNWISYTGKTIFSYWNETVIRPLVSYIRLCVCPLQISVCIASLCTLVLLLKYLLVLTIPLHDWYLMIV